LDFQDPFVSDLASLSLILTNKVNIWYADHIQSSDAFQFNCLLPLTPDEISFAFWAQFSIVHVNLLHDFLESRQSQMKAWQSSHLPSLYSSSSDMLQSLFRVVRTSYCYMSAVLSSSPQLEVSQFRQTRLDRINSASSWEKSILFGKSLFFESDEGGEFAPLQLCHHIPASFQISPSGKPWIKTSGIVPFNSSQIHIPDFGRLLADAGKMMVLDSLLTRLKKEGHRVLIFSQMKKMIDILEDYMRRKRYKMFRLDGSTDVFERRAMVNDFQQDDSTFAFLLSTRAGGLGITLTAVSLLEVEYKS
jgi:SNF2 family DNA or RNA helicase